MSDWVVTIISLVGSTVITTIIGAFVKHTMTKEFNKQNRLKELEEKELEGKRKDELQKELETQLNPIKYNLEEIKEKSLLTADGTLSSLRNDILTCYYRCLEKGYRNDYDYQNIHDLYESYFKLGGNSFIKDIMNRFDHLPTKEDVKDTNNTHLGTKKSNKKILNEKMKKEK